MNPGQKLRILRITTYGTIALSCCCSRILDAADLKAHKLETREFKVSVDGKPRGKCTMQIRRRDDGADTMQIDAAMSFNFVVYEYRYRSMGTEVWKDDRLLELDNTADFNGTKYAVKAGSTAKGLRATVNGKALRLESDVWVTSYWQLPDHLAEKIAAVGKGPRGKEVVPASLARSGGHKAAHAVSLLDSDKGQHFHGEMIHVGDETITVAGKRKACAHYRISGDVEVELWYDSARRLVRQQSVESGHKTLLEVTRIAAE
jgi:hypothetical protein